VETLYEIHNFLFCCFMLLGLQFQVTVQKDKSFEKFIGVSFILFMYRICTYCIAFWKRIWCFKDVFVDLPCLWLCLACFEKLSPFSLNFENIFGLFGIYTNVIWHVLSSDVMYLVYLNLGSWIAFLWILCNSILW